MELPEDVVEHIRGYAKPSKSYKMYALVMKILVDKTPPFVRHYFTQKLKAVRFHYDRFLPLFLKLEGRYIEMVLSVRAACANEHKRKMANFTSTNGEVLTQLNKL